MMDGDIRCDEYEPLPLCSSDQLSPQTSHRLPRSPIPIPDLPGTLVNVDLYKSLMAHTKLSDTVMLERYVRDLSVERNALEVYLRAIRNKLSKARNRLHQHQQDVAEGLVGLDSTL